MLKRLICITLFLIIALGVNNCQAIDNSKQNTSDTELNALLKEANSCLLTKDHAKCIELYEKVLKLDPKSAEAYYNIGGMYLWDDEPQKSLPYFQNALKYNPKNPLAYSAIAVNCDILADYDLTLKYINDYRKAYPHDKLNNELADKFEKTSNSKKEYSDKLISGVIPKVKMDVTAPKWVPGGRINNGDIIFSQIILRGKTIENTPEAISFSELTKLGKRFISSNQFANSYISSLSKKDPITFTSNIIETNGNQTIFETQNSKQYDIFKCVLDKDDIYIVNYTLKPASITKEKRQYWIDTLRKVEFIY